MRIFLFLFFIVTFNSAFADEDGVEARSESLAEIERCGMDEEKVIPLDGTLCRDDIAFGMLYEFFPSVYNELIPFWDLSMFSNLGDSPSLPETVGQYTGDDVMFVLYDMIYDILLWVGLVMIGLLTLHFLLRLMRGDPVFGDDNGDEGKDDTQSLAIGMGTGGLFLLSVKNFVVGMLIVFSLSMFALTVANSISSFYLSSMQTLYERNERPADAPVPPEAATDRHEFAADHFYRSLTQMQLCRMQSSSYGLTDVGAGYMTAMDYETGMQCQYGENRVTDKKLKDNSAVPAFIGFETGMVSSLAWYQISTERFRFGVMPKMHQQCRIEPVNLPHYDCGSMEVNGINWTGNPLIKLLDSPVPLVEVLNDLSSQIKPTSSPENIASAIERSWFDLKVAVDSAYEELDERFADMESENVILDNRVISRKAAFERAQDETRRPHYEDLIRKLSQFAMNGLMFGQYDRFVHEQTDYIVNEDFDALSYHASQAERLARIVREGHCYNFSDTLANSAAIGRFLNGSIARLPASASARCLDFPSADVLGYPVPWSSLPLPARGPAAEDKFNAQIGLFQREWQDSVTTLTEQRWAVEETFFDLVNELEPDDWWRRMRQRGYLAAPDYIQEAINKNQRMKDNLSFLIDNYDAGEMSFNTHYFDDKWDIDRDIEDLFVSYSYGGAEILNSTMLDMTQIDPLLDRSDWAASKRQYLRQGIVAQSSSWIEELIQILPSSQHILTRLGVSTDPEQKSKEGCLEESGKCPFVLTDPMVELSLVGHDILDVGITLYVLAIPVKGINELRAVSARAGSGTMGVENRFYQMIGKTSQYAGWAAKMLAKELEIFDFVFDRLSGLILYFMAVGLMLAYLLPFLPKLFIYLNFVTWFTIIVMASFGVMIWALYLIRMRENKEQIKSAGMHFAVQIMLRPCFNLIGVIFAIVFFYVVAFVIGLTAWWLDAMPVNGGFYNTSVIRYLTDTLIVISIFAFLYYVGIKIVFEVISQIEATMLTKFGVKASANNGAFNNVVKAIAFEQIKEQGRKLNRYMDKRGTTRGQGNVANDLLQYGNELQQQTDHMKQAASQEKDKKGGKK